ncbi:MAG TPA: hypothetical protein VD813_02150, partial [Pseudonocardia sp.]|nr:hypothetical protein [Pseudonocardia sp.]
SLLLYAPIDTLTVGTAEEDLPWAGEVVRPEMLPEARTSGPDGRFVTGLGAGNPKGHAACVLGAVEAVAAAVRETGTTLRGDLLAGFGAGGMPTNARPGARPGSGHGVGCSHLLEQGGHTDAAVIAKPGWTVAYEEVGLAWFDVVVRGTHTYVGSRHRLPYRNAIEAAGTVVGRLERWFDEYAAAHADGLVRPQGIVAAIEGGWRRTAALTPAVCRLRVDLRLSPRTTPAQAGREIGAVLGRLRAEGVELDWEPVLGIAGTSTDPGHWIARRAREAWEAEAGRPHADVVGTSGATDANILRSRGVPTVRVGMPKVTGHDGSELDFTAGMNTVDTVEMARLTRLLVRVAVDVVTSTVTSTGPGVRGG